jgi:hypothetical protein
MTEQTYEQRLAAVHRREMAEFDTPRAKYQALLDRQWQAKLDAAFEENRWKMVGGYLEPRHSTSCHKGRWDDDY